MQLTRPERGTTPVAHALFIHALFALLAGLFVGLPAVAQEPDQGSERQRAEPATISDEIVVSAGLVERPQQRIGSSVTVIDRDEIERRNQSTVLELLRTVPGLEVAQTGGPGKTTSVFIRGGNSSHTLVTIDGVRVNGNTTGAFDFSDLTTDNLERIEVIRGPQGLTHGSEAVAGAVHVITRRGEGPARAWLRAAGGSDNYSQFGAGVQGGHETLDYSVNVSRIETDGVSSADEDNGNSESDPWTNLNVSGRLGASFWHDGRAELAVRYTEGDTDVDGFTFGVGPTDDLNASQERTVLTTALSLSKPIHSRWTQSLVLSHGSDELIGKDPDNIFSNYEITGENSSIKTQADLTLSPLDTSSASASPTNTLSIGYQLERREAKNVGSFDESIDLQSFFVENLWSWNDRVDLSLGVRNDDHSIFGDETTYRVALSARLGEMARFHASTGTGFRAPTFNELYFPSLGNLDLVPETSEGFDAGFELSFDDGRAVLDVTYFDTDFEDLILFTFPGGFVNLAEAASSGVELTFSGQAGDRFHYQVSHTYNDTEDRGTGLQLTRRPENRTTLNASFDLTQTLRGNATVVAARGRIDSDGTDMDDYERVDLSLDYQMTERFQPFLRLENLLDSDYSEIPGYTTPGFTAVAGIHLDF